MSRIRYDQFERIVTVPLRDQSKTNATLKQFLNTAQCPPHFSQETCFVNMNNQSGEPILRDVPTGAVFSVVDGAPNCCGRGSNGNRSSCEKTRDIPTPFRPQMMTESLVFHADSAAPPHGFTASDYRGEARWFDGDEARHGTFWKHGPRAGYQVNLTGGEQLPFDVSRAFSTSQLGGDTIVNIPATFAYGANVRYPQAWPYTRALQ